MTGAMVGNGDGEEDRDCLQRESAASGIKRLNVLQNR